MHTVSPSVYPGTIYRKSKGDKHRFGDLDHVLAGADGLGDGGQSSKGLSNFLPALRLNIPPKLFFGLAETDTIRVALLFLIRSAKV